MNSNVENPQQHAFLASLEEDEQRAVEALINQNRGNNALTQRMALDASRIVSRSQERLRKQADAGFFKRFIGAISGSNKHNALSNQTDMLKMQKIAWNYLQQLQQQNLINAQAVAVIRNNLGTMNDFIIETRDFLDEAINRIEGRLHPLESNARLNKWSLNIETNKRRYGSLSQALLIVQLSYDFMLKHNDIDLTLEDINHLVVTLEKLGVNCDDEIRLLDFIIELIDQMDATGIDHYRKIIEISTDIQQVDSTFIQANISGIGFNSLYYLSDQYTKIMALIGDDELCNTDEVRQKIISRIFGDEFDGLNITYKLRDLVAEIVGGGLLTINIYRDAHALNAETEMPDGSGAALDSEPTEEIAEQVPREDVEIKGILSIAPGETKEFRNANLFFGSFINCEGTLILHNCSINYGDAASQVRILLKDGGQLQIEQSEIICLLSEMPQSDFITCEGKTTISIRNSILSDCSHFIKSADSVEISDCIIRNPGDRFIAPGYSSTSCNLLRTSFIFENPSDFKMTEYKEYGSLLYFDADYTGSSEITQCTFIANNCFTDGSRFTLINFHNGKVSDCAFEGVSNAIKNATAVERCSFKNVFNAIDSYSFKSSFAIFGEYIDLFNTVKKITSISNCTFLQCSNVFSGQHMKITLSQIYDCYGDIVNGKKMQFELCDFINIKPEQKSRHGDGSINFCCTSKDDDGIFFKHCRFDGYKGNGERAFATVKYPKSGMKGGITFDECTFENFSTPNGVSSLFEERATVEGLFSNSIIQVIRTINCTGLDRINKEGSESSRPKPADFGINTSSAAKVAAALAVGAIGITGVVPIATVGLAAAATALLGRK